MTDLPDSKKAIIDDLREIDAELEDLKERLEGFSPKISTAGIEMVRGAIRDYIGQLVLEIEP